MQAMLNALSPEATLRRGYSITRVGGKAITNATQIPVGTEIETTLANGTIISVTK
jgi:exodeoxyribonuclease VII large subunit